MNNTFNLKRFSWYFKKHTLDHGRTYVLSLAVAMGIVFLFLAIPALVGSGPVSDSYQYTMYLVLIWLGGSIFTSTIFAELGDRKKAILPLTLPVSHLEKFLVAWLYTFPIFLISVNACFFIIDSLVLSINHPTVTPFKLVHSLITQSPIVIALIMFVLFQVFCFWGAIYFKRLHFIKTAFAFFLALLIVSLLNKVILWLISGGKFSSSSLFFESNITVNNNNYWLTLGNNIHLVQWVIFGLAQLLLFVSTFYKLKEKQV
ncbi:hypothetical protein [Mucilaginibacter sp. dw_454]|uniref:hypothetical protein n=1 Tax=Mucilaginibacter sp. dw_454 TaxID=2720079 RepID=UPI001BD48FB6|nr:hypothetical protein [Mucilaginibacter sp. dw_454]